MHFSSAGAVQLPEEADAGAFSLSGDLRQPLPVTLVDTVAYIAATDHLLAVETRTGQLLGEPIRPQSGKGEPYRSTGLAGDNIAEPPLATNVGGHSRVYVAFVIDVPGSGTTPGHRSVELVGVDAAGSQAAWRTVVPLEKWANETSDEVAAVPVWSDGRTVLVRAVDQDYKSHATTYAIEVTSGKVLWTRDDFAARVVVGNTAVGEVPKESFPARISGVSVSDGGIRWTSPKEADSIKVSPAGPSLIAAYENTHSSDNRLTLVEAATGKVRYSAEGSYLGTTCQYDGISVTVCSQDPITSPWVAAFDATTGEGLWGLPDDTANRVAPTVTSTWRGAVYGTTKSGPVVLDSRSGKDRATAPGVAPYVVNGSVGLAVAPNGSGLQAFPADG